MLRVVGVGQQARRDGPLVQLRNIGLGFGRFVDVLFDALDLRCQEGAAIERFDERIASFVLSCKREFERGVAGGDVRTCRARDPGGRRPASSSAHWRPCSPW